MTNPGRTDRIGDGRLAAKRPAGAFGRTIPLGRWGGVAVSAHWTALFTLALFADVLATSVLPAARPGLGTSVYWLSGLLTSAVFLMTLVAHELAHAITARHLGMRVGGITLWMLGGLTELEDESPTPRADALVAIAGPATSIWLAAVSMLLAWWAGASSLFGAALSWLAVISVVLGLFNLLPGSPLDGGRLLRSLLWWRYADRARAENVTARAGRMLGFVLVGLGCFDVLAGSSAGLWLALVGWFIINGANTGRGIDQLDRLKGLRADDVMTLTPALVADWWTVEQYLAQATPDTSVQAALPLVNFAGQATGALTLRDLARVPPEQRAETRIRDIVRGRRQQALLVAPQTSVAGIAARLRQHGGTAIVVNDDNHPLGVITTAELARAARSVEHARGH